MLSWNAKSTLKCRHFVAFADILEMLVGDTFKRKIVFPCLWHFATAPKFKGGFLSFFLSFNFFYLLDKDIKIGTIKPIKVLWIEHWHWEIQGIICQSINKFNSISMSTRSWLIIGTMVPSILIPRTSVGLINCISWSRKSLFSVFHDWCTTKIGSNLWG